MHNGESIPAEVIYNFEFLENVVLVLPRAGDVVLKENILFTREFNSWTTSSPIKKTFPSTINSNAKYIVKEK
jgi:hypothetical protein